MVETRIKVQALADGTAIYIPQHKGLLFWQCFKQWRYEYSVDYKFTDIELAKKMIDEFLVDEKHKQDKKIAKTHYIKYP